jgi:CHASE2 domain-containing sensor protein
VADEWLNIGVAIYTGVALLLAAVAVRAWRHARSRKVGLLAGAFCVLLAKGLLLSVALFRQADWSDLVLPGLAFDVAALGLLYGAALRRG